MQLCFKTAEAANFCTKVLNGSCFLTHILLLVIQLMKNNFPVYVSVTFTFTSGRRYSTNFE